MKTYNEFEILRKGKTKSGKHPFEGVIRVVYSDEVASHSDKGMS